MLWQDGAGHRPTARLMRPDVDLNGDAARLPSSGPQRWLPSGVRLVPGLPCGPDRLLARVGAQQPVSLPKAVRPQLPRWHDYMNMRRVAAARDARCVENQDGRKLTIQGEILPRESAHPLPTDLMWLVGRQRDLHMCKRVVLELRQHFVVARDEMLKVEIFARRAIGRQHVVLDRFAEYRIVTNLKLGPNPLCDASAGPGTAYQKRVKSNLSYVPPPLVKWLSGTIWAGDSVAAVAVRLFFGAATFFVVLLAIITPPR